MSKTNEQLTQGTVLYAKGSDQGKITMVMSLENGESATLRINTKGFDESSRKYVDDEEVFERALDSLKTVGVDESLLDLKPGDKLDAVIADLNGKEFPVYYHDGRVSLNPIKIFPRYDQLSVADAKALGRRGDEVFTFEPMSDFDGRRFNLGFKTDIKGEDKYLRVSQIVVVSEDDEVEDKNYGLKYENAEIADIKEGMENAPAGIKDQLKKALDNSINKARENKDAELRDALGGRSILELIENEEQLKGHIKVQQIPGQGVYYLQTVLVEE